VADKESQDPETTVRVELGDFLRRRREALQPEDVGLPPGPRRRAPGLRRAEVALLATMSENYYERLEQARAPWPSAAILAAISRALRLTTEERDYLYRLSGQAPPAPADPVGEIDAGLSYILSTVAATTPAFISDALGTVVAQNALNIALFGDFNGFSWREANLVWRWFTSPPWRERLKSLSPEQEEATGLAYVADLRATLAQRGHDAVAMTMVAQLRAASTEFAAMWDQHRVSTLHCSTKVVDDDRVGRLELDCVIVMSAVSTQRLLVLQPVFGTPTAERLSRLAELCQEPNLRP
jgi:transcriptional regulator with XRE-family HTH domain